MRLAVLVTRFPAGSETFVIRQLEGLIARGHAPFVSAVKPGEDGDAAAPPGCEFAYRVPPGGAGARWLRLAARCVALLATAPGVFARVLGATRRLGPAWLTPLVGAALDFRRHGPFDVVYAHFGVNGRFAAELRRLGVVTAPIVTVFHGYDLSREVRERGEKIYDDLFTVGALHLPVSEEFAERLRRLGADPDRVRVHHMGIDGAAIPFRERTDEGRRLDLLSIARLVEKKGIAFALRAVAELRGHPRLGTYRIVGDGPQRAELESLVRELGLVDAVSFEGWRSHEEVLRLMESSDVLLAPSVTAADGDQEGIPVVLMEALASGAAVVASRHSGIPELVVDGETGLLADEGDVDGLAAALRRILDDGDLRRSLGAEGRRHVEREFEASVLDERLVTLLEAAARPDDGA